MVDCIAVRIPEVRQGGQGLARPGSGKSSWKLSSARTGNRLLHRQYRLATIWLRQPPSCPVQPVRSHLHPVLFRGWRRLQGKDVTLDWAPATLWSPRLYIPCLLHLGFSWNMIHIQPQPRPSGYFSSLLVVVSSCAPASPVTVQPRARNRFHSRVRPLGFPVVRPLQPPHSKTISTMSHPVIRTASPYTDPKVKGPPVQLLSSGHSSNLINKSSNSKYPNFQLSSLDNAHACTYTSIHLAYSVPHDQWSSYHRLRHPSRACRPKHLQPRLLNSLDKVHHR